MAKSYFFFVSLCLTWLVCGLNAEVVKTESCEGQCQIHEVRVEPCREAADRRPCIVKRGNSATISFDYTPEWSATKLHAQVFSVTDDGDLPMPGMDTDGCKHSTCPVQASTRQSYTYVLGLPKKFPKGTYKIKWVIRDHDKEEDVNTRCCFTTRIKLT